MPLTYYPNSQGGSGTGSTFHIWMAYGPNYGDSFQGTGRAYTGSNYQYVNSFFATYGGSSGATGFNILGFQQLYTYGPVRLFGLS